MAYLAQRSCVIPLAVALALAPALAGCGAITTVMAADGGDTRTGGPPDAFDDGPPPEARPEIGTIIEAGAEAGAETSSADAGSDLDTRKCTIKINEVQTGGAASALDEFIELYNTCPDRAFSLASHSLVYRSDVGTTNVILIMFGMTQAIPASRPFFLCVNASGFTGPAADAYYTSGLRDVGGGIALLGPDGQILDSVGWGTATNAFVEGTPAPAPAAGQSIARRPDGHDTDANAADFAVASAPTPGAAN